MPVKQEIRYRRWRWIGHTLCKPDYTMSFNLEPKGGSKRDERETHDTAISTDTSKKRDTTGYGWRNRLRTGMSGGMFLQT